MASEKETFLLFVIVSAFLAVLGRKAFDYKFVGDDINVLRLSCHAGASSSSKGDLNGIGIYDVMSGQALAWILRAKHPQAEDSSTRKNIFVAGRISGDNTRPGYLDVIMFEYDTTRDHQFGCNISYNVRLELERHTIMLTVNKTEKTAPKSAPAAVHQVDQEEATERDVEEVGPVNVGRSKSQVTKPSSSLTSLPMTVLIALMVLLSILVVLAVVLMIQRFTTHCRQRKESVYSHPAYYQAHEHLQWKDSYSTSRLPGREKGLETQSLHNTAAYPTHTQLMQPRMSLPPIPQDE